MYRRITIGAGLLAILLLPAAGPGQDVVSRNGTAWKKMPELLRDGYVLGLIDGTFQEMRLADPSSTSHNEQTPEENYLQAQRTLLTRKDGITPSPEEIVDGVNSFYSAPENLPVCMSHAVLIEWLSLAGNPDTTTDIQNYRQEDGQSGCKRSG